MWVIIRADILWLHAGFLVQLVSVQSLGAYPWTLATYAYVPFLRGLLGWWLGTHAISPLYIHMCIYIYIYDLPLVWQYEPASCPHTPIFWGLVWTCLARRGPSLHLRVHHKGLNLNRPNLQAFNCLSQVHIRGLGPALLPGPTPASQPSASRRRPWKTRSSGRPHSSWVPGLGPKFLGPCLFLPCLDGV